MYFETALWNKFLFGGNKQTFLFSFSMRHQVVTESKLFNQAKH